MSWLQKRTQVGDSIQFYTVGLSKTIVIVGLGNPGRDYDLTRHNVGFFCIDEFVTKNEEMQGWVERKDLKCTVSQGRFGETTVYALKPTTFMNLSGEAVQAFSNFYKIPAEHTIVIHDELDIDFGQIRLRVGGGSAGHNGIKSVTQHFGEGTNYGRIRIGIGPKIPIQIDSSDFVLQKFSAEQQSQLSNLALEVNAILSEYIYGGQALPVETRTFIV
ncbi:MAG: aminoacyl-tRNA hydrolase [Candidatus Saccharibacteria bacterium]